MIARTEESQITGLVSCFFRRLTMSCGAVPALICDPVTFMYTAHRGGFMLGNALSNASPNSAAAAAIKDVCTACSPCTLTCKAPAFSAASFRALTARGVPAQEKPFGKSSWAIEHTAAPPSVLRASSQSSSSFAFSKPATVIDNWSVASWATCNTSPRRLANRKPSSKPKTPAAQRAASSPKERPATAWQRTTASSRSCRNFSKPAMLPTNMTTWAFSMRLSSSSELSMHNASTS
mmetsp:Transcript_91248/g.261161  ORF Transcript_91248/g.261161 Transcript_91248/m.261161 type:complete len:235 (+) Transcript_91248:174-878(+)